MLFQALHGPTSESQSRSWTARVQRSAPQKLPRQPRPTGARHSSQTGTTSLCELVQCSCLLLVACIVLLVEHGRGTDSTQGDNVSSRNVQQARMVVEVVATLLAGSGLEAGLNDIGVITPYSGQVKRLQQAHCNCD